MNYYIYHDKVTRSAKLHRGDCGACKEGKWMHGHQNPRENEWYGPFASRHDAQRHAQQVGVMTILTDCGLCKP